MNLTRLSLLIGALVFLALPSAGTAQAPRRAATPLQAAARALIEGRYAEVDTLTEKLDTRDPNVVALRARAAIARGRYADAEASLRPVVSRFPTSEAALQLGLLMQMLGREFAPILDRVAMLSDTSSDPNEVARAGRALRALGRFREANAAYRDAGSAAPSDPAIQTAWGDLFLEKYNRPDALRSYQMALQVDARYVPALIGSARAQSARARRSRHSSAAHRRRSRGAHRARSLVQGRSVRQDHVQPAGDARHAGQVRHRARRRRRHAAPQGRGAGAAGICDVADASGARHVLQAVRVRAARTDPRRDLPEARRLRGQKSGPSRPHRRPRHLLRPRRLDGFAAGAAAGRIPVGSDALARAGARHHAADVESARAAVADRRDLGIRGAARAPGVAPRHGNRGRQRSPRFVGRRRRRYRRWRRL